MSRAFASLMGLFSRRASTPNEAVAPLKRSLAQLTANASYIALDLAGTDITELPPGISVQFGLQLRGCHNLRRLPDNLHVGSLDVSNCTQLERLPEGLSASFVDLSDCPQIETWPASGAIRVGRLRARNCTGLSYLPPWVERLSQLDLAGCLGLHTLPERLVVTSWVDIGGTSIRALPESMAGVGIRWRGVTVDERVAFRPEEITAEEVLAERNSELRRVKLERMGFERFLSEADPEVLDIDTDPGGERKLYRVELEGDEPLVCVSVKCPSTGRHYLLRVPPTVTTCRQGIAWTAGFDDPEQYDPQQET